MPTDRMTVSLDEDAKTALETLDEWEAISRSEIIRGAVSFYAAIVDNTDIGELRVEDTEQQVRSAVSPCQDLDAIFISCTNYRSIDALAPLEAAYDVPVISSNLATMWDLGNRLGIEPTIDTALGGVAGDSS